MAIIPGMRIGGLAAFLAAASVVVAGEVGSAPRPGPTIAVLSYHHIAADTTLSTYTIHPDSLRAHLRRARANGWTFVPLSTVIKHRRTPHRLPAKTMVVTFDDGYRSFVELALPILREEKVKPTLAIVSAWVDQPPAGIPPLLSWDEIRALDRGGQVEIASHSHDQHRFLTSNPYGDTEPAVTTRRYVADERRYETRAEYEARVGEDLRAAQERLHEKLGHRVTVLAWPYGEWNTTARRLAAEHGFTTTLGLEGTAVAAESLAAGYLPRVMVYREVPVGERDPSWLEVPRRTVRAAQVDLDDLHDPDPRIVDENIARVIERLRALGATDVFLQGLPDPAGDGFFTHAYFMNHQVPVRADLWSMVAHRLARQRLRIWIRVPSMNLPWAWQAHPEWRIPWRVDPTGRAPAPWYHRLSPDLAVARRAAVDFYTDLAVYLPIRGVLFDDDAHMRSGEALVGTGERGPVAKREAIRGMLEEIKAGVRAWRPQTLFGRVLYPGVLARPGVDPDFAQDLEECLRKDDLVVVSAVPGPESGMFSGDLVREAARAGQAAGATPLLLRFHAYDPAGGRWLDATTLAGLVHDAERAGARHVGIARVAPEGGAFPDGLLRPAQNPVLREIPHEVRE
jgi:biofilm PGA synthesis lipoprotein PgaB